MSTYSNRAVNRCWVDEEGGYLVRSEAQQTMLMVVNLEEANNPWSLLTMDRETILLSTRLSGYRREYSVLMLVS
jgi:hypothetical protein